MNVFVCLGPYVFVLVLQRVGAFAALLHSARSAEELH